MSTPLDAEFELQSHTWLERARCAAIGLAIHSAVLLMCLLTANPIYKGLPPIFIPILFVSVLLDVIASFCFFYGFQEKNRWCFLPLMLKQGVEAVFRSLMLLALLFLYAEYLINRFHIQSSYASPNGPEFEAFQMAYLLPFNVISIFCFVKAFDALRPSSPIHVPSRDNGVFQALQSFLWIERARCVAIGFSIRVGIAMAYLVTAIAFQEESKCFPVAAMVADNFVFVLCLACCFRGLYKEPYSQWWLLPITVSQAIETLARVVMSIQLVVSPSLPSSPDETCSGFSQAVALYLPLHIIAFYCFAKAMMIISRGIPSTPSSNA